MAQDVYIVGAARLPIGKFGGKLARFSLTELGTTAASAAIERSGIPAAEIDTAVASNVMPVIPSDLYISRKVAIGVGMPESSTAMGVNRLCGSGVQAVVSAAQLLQSGDGTVALAIGAESMSQAPYSVEGARFGKRMGDGKLVAHAELAGAGNAGGHPVAADAIGNKTRGVAALECDLAQGLFDGGAQRGLGLAGGDELDQAHDLRRVEEVGDAEALAARDRHALDEIGQREGRGVRTQDG